MRPREATTNTHTTHGHGHVTVDARTLDSRAHADPRLPPVRSSLLLACAMSCTSASAVARSQGLTSVCASELGVRDRLESARTKVRRGEVRRHDYGLWKADWTMEGRMTN